MPAAQNILFAFTCCALTLIGSMRCLRRRADDVSFLGRSNLKTLRKNTKAQYRTTLSDMYLLFYISVDVSKDYRQLGYLPVKFDNNKRNHSLYLLEHNQLSSARLHKAQIHHPRCFPYLY